jgi:hypothetical protein
MRNARSFPSLALLTLCASAAGLSAGCTNPFSKTFVISPSTVDGSAVLAEESALLGPQSVTINLQGTLTQFPGNAHLDELKIRTLLSDPSDQTDAALTDESKMNGCQSGQDHIDFIDSIVINIKKQGADDSTYVELAQGSYDASSPCSISLTPNDSINLADYASGYEIEVVPTGKYPDHTIQIGGLISGSWSP